MDVGKIRKNGINVTRVCQQLGDGGKSPRRLEMYVILMGMVERSVDEDVLPELSPPRRNNNETFKEKMLQTASNNGTGYFTFDIPRMFRDPFNCDAPVLIRPSPEGSPQRSVPVSARKLAKRTAM